MTCVRRCERGAAAAWQRRRSNSITPARTQVGLGAAHAFSTDYIGWIYSQQLNEASCAAKGLGIRCHRRRSSSCLPPSRCARFHDELVYRDTWGTGPVVWIGKKAAASPQRPATSKDPRDLHTPLRPRGDGGSIAASRQAAAYAARRKGCSHWQLALAAQQAVTAAANTGTAAAVPAAWPAATS